MMWFVDAIAAHRIPHEAQPEIERVIPRHLEGREGTSTGLNIAPGSDDDGWLVPPSVVLADGTRVQLYKDGEALHAAFNAIKHAKRRICLEVYIFNSDDTGRAFADLLSQKAREGVEVYVIYDSFGSIRTDPSIFRQMRRAGVRLQEFHPLKPWRCKYSWRPANRDHRKLLIVDDHIAGMGGLNVGAEYAGSWVVPSTTRECDLWRDNAIGLVGPSARLLLKSFINTWHYVARGGRIRRAEFHHPINGGDFGILASVPTLNSPLGPLLNKLLSNAKESIELTMAYFAPPDELIELLCAAAKRNVRVRLMLPARCDVRLLITAARSFYENLMAAGVEIYERQTVILHAKTMLIDRELTVLGSTNLDYRSIEYNCELSALIKSRRFGEQMHELFEHDVKFAKRISLGQCKRTPMVDRFLQWAVMRARYLL